MRKRTIQTIGALAGVATALLIQSFRPAHSADKPFNVMETTIADVHAAYKSGKLTAHQLTQMYLDRIAAYLASAIAAHCGLLMAPGIVPPSILERSHSAAG